MKLPACLVPSLFVFSVTIACIGIIGYWKFPDIFQYRLQREINFKQGSQLFDKWKTTPVPLDYKVYVLEVVNPRRVVDGSKPILRERGPFHFTEYRRKEIIGYSTDGQTVKYKEYRDYYFDRSKSNYSLDRRVTFVNVPVVTIATRITEFLNQLPFQPLTRPIVNGAIGALLDFHNQNLFTTRTVRELLFDGYRVNVLDTIKLISMPLKLIGINIPHIPLINNTFGVFHNKNGTAEGPFEVFTGISDHSKIGQFVTWKGKGSLDHWKGSACNVLNGTDGMQFSPMLQKEDILTVFIFEACRSVLLGFDRETEVKGIKTFRYKTLPQSFRSAKVNADNWCFCNKRKRSCNYDGVIDISPCWFNAPLYASNPHLYNASKSLQSKVKGLKPDEERHTSFADIEPTTGTVLRGMRRFELNVEIKNFSIISNARNILRPAIIPILWVEEGSQLSDELRDELKLKLFTVKMIAEVSIRAMIGLGFILLAVLFVIVFCKRGRSNAVDFLTNSPKQIKPTRKQKYVTWILAKVTGKETFTKMFRTSQQPGITEMKMSESGSETSVATMTSNVSMEPSIFETRRQSVGVLKSKDLLDELKQMQTRTQKDKMSVKQQQTSEVRRSSTTNHIEPEPEYQSNSSPLHRRPSLVNSDQEAHEPRPLTVTIRKRPSIVSIDHEPHPPPPPPNQTIRRRSSLVSDIPQKSSKKLKKQLSFNLLLPPMKEEPANGKHFMCHGLQTDTSIVPPVEVIPKIHRVDDRRMSLHF